MPIKIPYDLPARPILEAEGVHLIRNKEAIRQDIRPLRIALLNLMPQKIKTETQIARVLASSPLQIEMTLIAPTDYVPKNTSREHMIDFYKPFDDIRDQKYDGLIVTGAPIEKMPFEDVDYWVELQQIFDWSLINVHSLFTLCWGAQAALQHFYGIPKYMLPEKRFGVFNHRVKDHTSLLTRGMNDEMPIPVSRYTENHREDLDAYPHLEVIAESDEAGLCLIHDTKLRHVHMFNHLEYDSHTLGDEYKRDLEKGDAIQMPLHYYPDDNPDAQPVNTWRANAHLLFGNWLNYIYQNTPYNIELIGAD
ncbi:MAG: homoserine O-succinyltransferase [Rhodospirillales bacterium]|jgi:homoserine O-succinyltransferase/O-acetyltransferase|nr:homoserine O-succinyltransferase [Rhodospirillales bacterium]MBT4040555.1 homoserine O-succinyltransferase [Rhodospirillales bacterium]MBT4627000.1 homoserine O-succinyltransferase [Rhodospirillales bacterium]MBT5352241.1 homoserine O-succinyltransferase [Rhodospirillales bacterium]MBT5522098.1 homoserine O-succinyltransferase [Rhodospirillales bacterium]